MMEDKLTTLEAANIVDHMRTQIDSHLKISKFLNNEISTSGLYRIHKQGNKSVSDYSSKILKDGYEKFLEEYDLTARDHKEYEQQLSEYSNGSARKTGGTFHKLTVGGAYVIEYRETEEDKRSEVEVIADYPCFYLVMTDKGIVTTILKNDLYTSKYKIKKSHNGGAVAGSTN